MCFHFLNTYCQCHNLCVQLGSVVQQDYLLFHLGIAVLLYLQKKYHICVLEKGCDIKFCCKLRALQYELIHLQVYLILPEFYSPCFSVT